jgi:hypothetical protein
MLAEVSSLGGFRLNHNQSESGVSQGRPPSAAGIDLGRFATPAERTGHDVALESPGTPAARILRLAAISNGRDSAVDGNA